MSRLRQIVLVVIRLAAAVATMVLAYTISSMVVGQVEIAFTPEEESRAAGAMLIVAAANAFVLSYLIRRSPWYGVKLMTAIALVQFGVETFMTQIETLYFNQAVQMSMGELFAIMAAGAVRALLFAPVAVFIWGRLRHSTRNTPLPVAQPVSRRLRLLAALAVFYVVVYFLFGYFVTWQWEETRLFYTGSTAIKPFLVHFRDLFLRDDPLIIPFQLLRGCLWAGLAALIVRLLRGPRWEAAVVVALTWVSFMALPLGLFPNPYMPPAVVQSHFIEIATSMALFGAVAGWTLCTAPVAEASGAATPVTGTPGDTPALRPGA